MKIFLDTGFFIAYFLKSETLHSKVVARYKFYRRQKAGFFTSNYILDELFTWLTRNLDRPAAERIIGSLEIVIRNRELRVFYIDEATDKKARAAFLKFFDQKLSFTDATTYVLYKDFRLDGIFTLDADFKKIGAAIAI